MQNFLMSNASNKCLLRDRANERGAALISVLLLSVLLLSAGGALILTTAMSATNAIDATGETQAYYAAEAGLQATLHVLRGNVAPDPLFDASSTTGPANKISFRKAVTLSSSNQSGDTSTEARLSRWLNYNVTLPGRTGVGLSSPYSFLSGMAYTATITDPDNTINQTYSTLGSFGSDSPSSSAEFEFKDGNDKVTVYYDRQASTAISAAGTTLGTFRVGPINGIPPISGHPKSTFVITIRQVTSSGAIDVPIKCTLALVGGNSVSVTFQGPSATSNDISGTSYVHGASVTIAAGGSASIPVTITPPEPSRVHVTVVGHGPRGAKKQMQMLVSRFAFDFAPNAAITVRGADSGASATIAIGNSSQYTYSGNDSSGGTNLPGFLLTNANDYATASALVPAGSTQVTGSPAVQQSSPSNLSSFLQTAEGARTVVDSFRIESQLIHRYFTTENPPTDFGASSPKGLLTFVDGNVDLPPSGGAGLLIVTGTLTMHGSAEFKGLILVLGGGQLIRNGGGNGTTLGSIVIASFGSSGGFLAPTFDSNGGGTSNVNFDSVWTRQALETAGPRVVAVSEY